MKKIFTSILCFIAFVCATQAQPVLYGNTPYGGINNSGVLFSFNASTAKYAKLVEFDTTNAIRPWNSLVQANDNKLYGLTSSSDNNKGVIFSYDPATTGYAEVFYFNSNGLNGGNPIGNSLMKAADGKLYGETTAGGVNDRGVIFSYDPVRAEFVKLFDFDNANGAYPRGSLVQASNGKLYGMTEKGGSSDLGVIFSFDLATGHYTKLIDFDGVNGAYPRGSLVQASNGKLYGVAFTGGTNNFGVIFSYDPTTSTFTKLLDFDGTIGKYPNESLIQASNGKLYGTTPNDNGDHAGLIFSFDPGTNTYAIVIDLFDRSMGAGPVGSLMQASDGKLYGETFGGGVNEVGVIFSVDPATNAYIKLKDFNDADGENPGSGAALVEYKPVKINTYYLDGDKDSYGNPNVSKTGSTKPEGYVTNKGDCGDSDKNIHPGATEICNGRDDNCNGKADEGVTSTTYYWDADGDGYGRADSSIQTCMTLQGYVTNRDDCDDTNKAIHPGATEVCDNGKDDDCDGLIDEGCNTNTTTWYRDADGDGFGNPNSRKEAPIQPRGYVGNNQDCNDKNKVKGGPEVCDGIDNDCDGIIDDGLTETTFYSDFDGDGYGSPKRTITTCAAPPRFVAVAGDCNDDNGRVYPGAPELCDGRDNDCDGEIDEGFEKVTFYHDFDKDGYGRAGVTKQACAAPLNYVARAGDCNDRDADVHPGGPALCDGKDNDCDGKVDENCSQITMQATVAQKAPVEQGLKLQITAVPNPASHYFSLRITSNSTKVVELRIVDEVGRVVEVKRGLAANTTVPVGHQYRPGAYFAQVLQDGKKASLKLVKTSQ